MEFDKSKVYTALNADESLIGAKGYFADTLNNLEYNIAHQVRLMKVKCIVKGFIDSENSVGYNFFYLVEPASENASEEWYVLEYSDGSYSVPTKHVTEDYNIVFTGTSKEECNKWIAEHSKSKHRPFKNCSDGLFRLYTSARGAKK